MDKAFWDSKYSTKEYVYTKEVNRFVQEHLEALAPGKMIDLAGGEGRNTVFFAQKGWQAENIDLSSVGLEKCKALAKERGVSDKVVTTNASALDFVSKLAPVDLGVLLPIFRFLLKILRLPSVDWLRTSSQAEFSLGFGTHSKILRKALGDRRTQRYCHRLSR
jgi:hypothetical protein